MQTIGSLSLVPGPDTVTQALGWLETLAERLQWPPRLGFQLGLCLDEALTNVVLYGFQGRAKSANDAEVRIVLAQRGADLLVDIIDNGTAFDPTRQEAPPLAASLEDADIGGHGLRLMRHYLQDIQYHRENGRNHLRMVAKLDS
ncbi:ATP-binding protein [Parapusillimonas sp. JC17]|uniref:ATP-binding protein n=1 Tax=Parapusillimonas sp. JC17 TaxID=3445768 RepID=UPI003F9F365A